MVEVTTDLLRANFLQDSELLTIKVNWRQIRVNGIEGGLRSLVGVQRHVTYDVFDPSLGLSLQLLFL